MSTSRRRSPSADVDIVNKKRKVDDSIKAEDCFEDGVLGDAPKLAEVYIASRPFKHVCVPTLFQDDLLEAVKDECINELSFSEKETDIYKVWTVTVDNVC